MEGVRGKAPQPPQPDPELDDDVPEQTLPDPELDDAPPEQKPPPDPVPDLDDELDDDELDDDEPEPSKSDSGLPPMYCHGDPDPRPIKSWAIKRLMPAMRSRPPERPVGRPTRPSSCSISRRA